MIGSTRDALSEKDTAGDNGARRKGSPTGNLAENLQNVAGDIADLVELQSELFAVDLRRTIRRLLVPLVLGIVGALVVATASLLAFAGIGLLLHDSYGFTLHAAFLLASAGALGFGLLCLGLAYLIVRIAGIPLSRSWHELKLNLAWTRRALFGARSNNKSADSSNPQ